MADVDCKGEKVPAFLSVRKILKKWLNLIQFCCVWILALSHQAPYKNLRFLEYWEELFLFLFWRISLTNFSIHWVSHSRLWHQRTKRLFLHFKPRVLNAIELWRWWASSACIDVWSSRKRFHDIRRCTVVMNIEHSFTYSFII